MIEFESLPFEQAVAYFRSLGVVPTQDYREMWDLAGERAFTVAKLTEIDLLEDVKRHMDRAIEQGTSLAEFKQNVGDLLTESGWGGIGPKGSELASSTRLENVYRTNLSAAYANGEYDQMRTSAAARAGRGLRTLLSFNAVGDDRTRPEHEDLDGTTLPIEHPFWEEHAPPLDFACRCWTTEETDASLERQDRRESAEPHVAYAQHVMADGSTISSPVGVGPGFGTRNWDQAAQDALGRRMAASGDIGEAVRRQVERRNAAA